MTYFLEGSSKLDPKVHFCFVRAFYMNIAHVDIPSFLTFSFSQFRLFLATNQNLLERLNQVNYMNGKP